MAKGLQRAISPEQKKERLLELMKATDELFQENTYHEITLTVIAEKLGWARGNLYKYVKTKEEIFLELYLLKQREFINDFNSFLQGKSKISHEEVSIIMSQAFEKNLDYLKYHSLMTTIIETNVSIERLAEFKRCSYFDRESIFEKLSKQCPELDKNQITGLFLTILYHGCGLYARTQCTCAYVQAMSLAKLPVIEVDFQASYSQFILMCLNNYR